MGKHRALQVRRKMDKNQNGGGILRLTFIGCSKGGESHFGGSRSSSVFNFFQLSCFRINDESPYNDVAWYEWMGLYGVYGLSHRF